MKRRITAAALTAALAVSLFAGCGQTGVKEGTTESGAAETKTEESAEATATGGHGTLKVSFLPGNIRIAVNILALEKDYFEEEGVTVEPVNIAGQEALTAIAGDGDQVDRTLP